MSHQTDRLAAAERLLARPDLAANLEPTDRQYINACRKAEADTKRGWRILQVAIYVLFIGVIASLIGWINQAQIAQQWRWYTSERPFAATNIWPYVLKSQAELLLKSGDSFRECSPKERDRDYCPDMIVVPAGAFDMGSPQTDADAYPNEFPQHAVIIGEPFAISKFELTFAEWDTCFAHGGCAEHPDDHGWGRGDRPAIFVSWYDAQQYVTWLSKLTGKRYRLLSESEYEYAARAGTRTAYPWGNDLGKNNGNCRGCGSRWDEKQTAPVGSFPPNKFGLYEVGNVWEWVEDCLHPNYQGAPEDGSAWTSGDCSNRVVRGGAWYAAQDKLRSADRSGTTPVYRDNLLGFRVARALKP